MKKTLIFPLIFVSFWGVACGGDDGARRGNQAAYETVQEGSAAGVTSTIHGPGEALPPVTGTNADTTTAFTIDPSVASAVPPPNVASGSGTLAGTLPSQPSYPPPMTSATPPPQRTYPQPQPQQSQRTYPQPQQQQPRPAEREQPEPQQQPPATDTAVTTPPQQQAPVTNANPPQQQEQPQPQPQPQQPPATNTNPPEEEDSEEEEEEPPPPPTTTDTRGN